MTPATWTLSLGVMSSQAYITRSAAGIDLSPRFAYSTTVAASPSAGTETTIATVTVSSAVAVETGVVLFGYCGFTAGTSGVSATLKLRQTGTSGSTVASTGATTVVAASLYERAVMGVDTAAVLPGQVYVLTLLIGSGAAASTVSSVFLGALIV